MIEGVDKGSSTWTAIEMYLHRVILNCRDHLEDHDCERTRGQVELCRTLLREADEVREIKVESVEYN